MFTPNIPAKSFGGQSKRELYSSLSRREHEEELGADIFTDAPKVFLNDVVQVFVKHLLHAELPKKNTEILMPKLSGATTFLLAKNKPDNIYGDDCIPCKRTYRSKHVVHRKLVPYLEQETLIEV